MKHRILFRLEHDFLFEFLGIYAVQSLPAHLSEGIHQIIYRVPLLLGVQGCVLNECYGQVLPT